MGRIFKFAMIGKGGFGTITREGGGLVAKRFAPATTLSFYREVTVLNCLDHPAVIRVAGIGGTAANPYYTMQEYPTDLHREHSGGLTAIYRDVAAALAYCHDRGVIHCDVKPANILMKGGRAVLADFGSARFAGDAAPLRQTPGFAAPDTEVTTRVDCWALGAIILLYSWGHAEPITADSAGIVAKYRLPATRFGALTAQLLERDHHARTSARGALTVLGGQPAYYPKWLIDDGETPLAARLASQLVNGRPGEKISLVAKFLAGACMNVDGGRPPIGDVGAVLGLPLIS